MHLSLQVGCTALIMASEAGKVECVKVLLDTGAEVSMQDKVNKPTCNVQNKKCHRLNHGIKMLPPII